MKLLAEAPLDLLHAFEAADRTKVFALVASELGLSPSAISHAIRELENLFDVHLFQRNTQEVALTKEGEVPLERIQRGFNELQQGLALVTASGSRPLCLHTTPSFTHQWLLPHLGKFIRESPSTGLRLSTSTGYVRFKQGDFDLDIVYSEPRPSPYEKIPLAVEGLTPPCPPQLAERLEKPEDLYALTLTQYGVQLYQWKGRFRANKTTPPNSYDLRFNRSSMAIVAAVDGLGVVPESKLLAEREIASGKLVYPLANSASKIYCIGHYLVFPQHQHMYSALDVLRTWLLDEPNLGKIR